MIKIGLDLSTRTVGLAILDNQKLIYDSYISKEKNYLKLQIEIVDWVFKKITPFLPKEHKLIIEDLFVGFDPYSTIDTARIQGAIIDKYYQITNQFPIFIEAITVRKRLNLETNLSKAEYQLYIIEKFKIKGLKKETKGEIIRIGNYWELKYRNLMNSRKNASKILKEKINKDIKELNKITKNSFNKLSTQLTKETGINSHIADAIILTISNGIQTPQN